MFSYDFRTQRLRSPPWEPPIRFSAPSSGSARRRARERLRAEQTRAEGECLARNRREQRHRDKLENQRKARAELASYAPWGRAGGGAPNSLGVRFTNLRVCGIIPEDELRGVSVYEACRRWPSPAARRGRTPVRLREDPQTCYTETLKKTIENDVRYRQTPDQQKNYKEILDELVGDKRRHTKEERRRDLEYEQKMQTLDGPWGKPGPGGTNWRNPGDIGLNFSKSMGWTDNEMFNHLKRDHRRQKRSSLTLPQVKKDDDEKQNAKPTNIDKLPDINNPKNSELYKKDKIVEFTKNTAATATRDKRPSRRPAKKSKFVKRLTNGERINKIIPEDVYDDHAYKVNSNGNGDKKMTPEESILRMTGGIELVPIIARRRRIGPRTLPSSDVTRPPEQPCQWREMMDAEYLVALKKQMRAKVEQTQENLRNSAERVRRHHATWASLWGRPGHGAPQQRGRYARSNLAQLLYVAKPDLASL